MVKGAWKLVHGRRSVMDVGRGTVAGVHPQFPMACDSLSAVPLGK